jgi:hypothetical protein
MPFETAVNLAAKDQDEGKSKEQVPLEGLVVLANLVDESRKRARTAKTEEELDGIYDEMMVQVNEYRRKVGELPPAGFESGARVLIKKDNIHGGEEGKVVGEDRKDTFKVSVGGCHHVYDADELELVKNDEDSL